MGVDDLTDSSKDTFAATAHWCVVHALIDLYGVRPQAVDLLSRRNSVRHKFIIVYSGVLRGILCAHIMHRKSQCIIMLIRYIIKSQDSKPDIDFSVH